MTAPDDQPLTLQHKLNRLFAYFHSATETELSSGALAFLLGNKLGREISTSDIRRARSGSGSLPADVCDAVCSLMGVADFYLAPSPDDETDSLIKHEDARLHLWSAARDRGVEGLIARNATEDDLEVLIVAVEQLPLLADTPTRPHHLSVVAN